MLLLPHSLYKIMSQIKFVLQLHYMLQDDEYCSGQSVSSCNSPMVIRGPDSLVIKKWILVLLVLALLLSFSMLIVISVQHYQVLAKVAQIHRHDDSGNFETSVSTFVL